MPSVMLSKRGHLCVDGVWLNALAFKNTAVHKHFKSNSQIKPIVPDPAREQEACFCTLSLIWSVTVIAI